MFDPTIASSDKFGQRQTDLISYLLEKERTILIAGEIDQGMATGVILQLEYLSAVDAGDITLFINSPGGDVLAAFGIIDAMQRSRCDVATVCLSQAASAAALLLTAGTKGKRYCTPHGEVMIHQLLAGMQGQASDIEIAAAHMQATRKTLNHFLAVCTGQTEDRIVADSDRNFFLIGKDAICYGLVDKLYGAPDG